MDILNGSGRPCRPQINGAEEEQRPNFFTPAMWLIWLVRTDARANAPLNDPEAQREFVAWWVLYGRTEYPALWWIDAEHVAIAMEEVTVDDQTLPRLIRRIYADRDDVRGAFPLRGAEAVSDLLCWYRLSGPIELSCAPILPPKFLRFTELMTRREPWVGAPGVPRIAAALHARRTDLQKRFNPSTCEARVALALWYNESGHLLIPPPTPMPFSDSENLEPTSVSGSDTIGLKGRRQGMNPSPGAATVLPHDYKIMMEGQKNDRLRPHFFTVAMWFAWLLRADARADAALDDPEAQREFRRVVAAVWAIGVSRRMVV